MKNKNMIVFVVLSVLLLWGYQYLTTRLNPPKPAPVQSAGPAPAAAGPAAAPAAPGAPAAAAAAPAVDLAARFTLRNDTLALTWRKGDGALVQVEWRDGTKFFPEARPGKDEPDAAQFPGLAAAVNTRFDGDPEVADVPGGRTVTFHNAQGDRLTYTVPAQGHMLTMEWASPKGAALNLLPRPDNLQAVLGLGRVFTIEPSSIKAVAWSAMLKDPFFSFLGARRKDLPPASPRLGMDAGVDLAKPSANHYFAAIWDASREPVRDPAVGYFLAPEGGGKVSARLYLGPQAER